MKYRTNNFCRININCFSNELDETQSISFEPNEEDISNPDSLFDLVLPIICSSIRNVESIYILELPIEVKEKIRDYFVMSQCKLKRTNAFVYKLI